MAAAMINAQVRAMLFGLRSWRTLSQRGQRDPPPSRLLLPQDRDDLLLAEPAALHRPSPLSVVGLYSNLEAVQGLTSRHLRSATAERPFRESSSPGLARSADPDRLC